MEETLTNRLMLESFDKLDENELSLILNQVGRRMLMLRVSTPDASFWFSVLARVSKWLQTEPVVNEAEKKFLIDPPLDNGKPVSGRVKAMKSMRERTGAQLSACKEIVDAWIKENLHLVHNSVRESWLCNKKNMEAKANGQV